MQPSDSDYAFKSLEDWGFNCFKYFDVIVMCCILIVVGRFEYLDRMAECKFDTIKPCRGLNHTLNPLKFLAPPRNVLLTCSLLKVASSQIVQSLGQP